MEKLLSEYYTNGRGGLKARCKACYGAVCAAQYTANKHKHSAKRRAYSAAYRAANPDKVRAASAEWRVENPGKMKAAKDAWKAANPEWAKAYNAARDAANPGEKKARYAAWARVNPGKVNARNAKRKAGQLNATPEWANAFFIGEIYALAALRTKLTGFAWHVDHDFPLCGKLVCGLHVENNLCVIPGIENLRKGNTYVT